MSGRLIVIEGLDGSGKATQAKLLYEALKSQGKQVCKVSFPDYESDSSALVKMYLGGQFGMKPGDVNAYAASTFYAVDRYASFKKVGVSFIRMVASSLRIDILHQMRFISAQNLLKSGGLNF